jgi:hypothetical protein
MQIAQRKARNRILSNIIWIRSWIEGILFLGIGKFDELQCSGVLHHLKNPSFGLKLLKDTLSCNGKMGLMVYAKYGRTGAYHIRKLMRIINSHEHEIETELRNTNYTLSVLPKRHWFNVTMHLRHRKEGNVGIYDLLLHKRDVAFSIDAVLQWIEMCGLHFVEFYYNKQRFSLKIQYVFQDDHMKKMISKLDIAKQLHGSEMLLGKSVQQSFYAAKIQNNIARILNPSNVLYMYGIPHGFKESLTNERNFMLFGNETYFIAQMREKFVLPELTGFKHAPNTYNRGKSRVVLCFKSSNFNHFLIDRLSSSKRGIKLKTLYSDYRKTSNSTISNDELLRSTIDFYNSVKDTDLFLLRNKYIAPFPKTAFLNFWQIYSI